MQLTVKTGSLLAFTLILLLGSLGCATEDPPPLVFKNLVQPFVFDALALTPIEATLVGYHEHPSGGHAAAVGEEGTAGDPVALDELLDDYSPEGLEKRVGFYKNALNQLHERVKRERLSQEPWADYAVLDNYLRRTIFRFDEERVQEHDPNLYVELIGNALYGPFVLQYADETQRFGHIVARLQKFPEFLNQAKQNLKSSSDVRIGAAQEGTRGLIRLIEDVIPQSVPDAHRADYQAASKTALQALREFQTYLAKDLSSRGERDWRLGVDLFTKKIHLALTTDRSLDQLLEQAEADFEQAFKQCVEIAAPIHRKMYGNQRPPTELAMMLDVLEVLSDENRLRRPDDLLDRVKQEVKDAREFAKEQEIVPLPSGENLQITATPPFLRELYPVAGFLGAPPLQPSLNAYFFITTIPSDLSRSALLAKLRELNSFRLKLLTFIEAVPGSYVQTEFGNDVEAPYLRVLRNVFGDLAYLRGWGPYITGVMVDAGYQDSSDELKVMWVREKLRIIADSILDIRLHTTNMSESEAIDMMVKRAFLPKDIAESRIHGIQLTPADLSLPYFGSVEWFKVREHYQTETTDFSLTSFHGKALRLAPLSLVPELGYLVAERPMEEK